MRKRRLNLRLALSGLLLSVALVASACGGGDPASAPPPAPAGPPAPPAELTIEEALASAPEGPVAVTGFIVASEDQPVRLCSALLESYPPQCGQPALTVEGLDLDSVDGLTRPDDPQFAHTAWTDQEISLTGELTGDVLAVTQGAQGG
jgi:hypothetical protein